MPSTPDACSSWTPAHSFTAHTRGSRVPRETRLRRRHTPHRSSGPGRRRAPYRTPHDGSRSRPRIAVSVPAPVAPIPPSTLAVTGAGGTGPTSREPPHQSQHRGSGLGRSQSGRATRRRSTARPRSCRALSHHRAGSGSLVPGNRGAPRWLDIVERHGTVSRRRNGPRGRRPPPAGTGPAVRLRRCPMTPRAALDPRRPAGHRQSPLHARHRATQSSHTSPDRARAPSPRRQQRDGRSLWSTWFDVTRGALAHAAGKKAHATVPTAGRSSCVHAAARGGVAPLVSDRSRCGEHVSRASRRARPIHHSGRLHLCTRPAACPCRGDPERVRPTRRGVRWPVRSVERLPRRPRVSRETRPVESRTCRRARSDRGPRWSDRPSPSHPPAPPSLRHRAHPRRMTALRFTCPDPAVLTLTTANHPIPESVMPLPPDAPAPTPRAHHPRRPALGRHQAGQPPRRLQVAHHGSPIGVADTGRARPMALGHPSQGGLLGTTHPDGHHRHDTPLTDGRRQSTEVPG
ncbi:hypothetical protein SAMN04489765_0234 [Tsukamurella pulmonis]|uniref:Uncharacterized protein n=1 Tax=Tsukamurella pulmonis TaxID=47312 RepID=A0A1H1AI21_9ACTN|nr:hypothetical protein SAMN04489765_0234 [Tsukamurella pulmonis]SUP26616.1 Uncharacterised protein [Tsukamurella pulmonis]